MARKKQSHTTREYSFTVQYEPIKGGYQVSVPVLTGLVTFGRTFDEARSMARDAIKCHLKALKKNRFTIPTEGSLVQERLTVTA